MYGDLPHIVKNINSVCTEMMFYQYLPIKMVGMTNIYPEHNMEKRLHWANELIGSAICDFVAFRGLKEYVNSYIYISAKHLYQHPEAPFNRTGWHSDGFMTNDVNYIWSNRVPTVFNSSDFNLSQDDRKSMVEMTEQAKPENDVTYPDCNLIRLTQDNIHRVGDDLTGGFRTFVKISFSKDKYNLAGNSKNYLLQYDWEMKPRSAERNIPQK